MFYQLIPISIDSSFTHTLIRQHALSWNKGTTQHNLTSFLHRHPLVHFGYKSFFLAYNISTLQTSGCTYLARSRPGTGSMADRLTCIHILGWAGCVTGSFHDFILEMDGWSKGGFYSLAPRGGMVKTHPRRFEMDEWVFWAIIIGFTLQHCFIFLCTGHD